MGWLSPEARTTDRRGEHSLKDDGEVTRLQATDHVRYRLLPPGFVNSGVLQHGGAK